MHVVRLISRRTCGLCDRAREALVSEGKTTAFRFEEVLVDGDDALEREYGLRVPVVLVDGEEAFEIEVDRGRLRQLLAAPRPG